jgi:hypothetical protein
MFHSHSNQEGLTAARKLCESLIQTVQKDFEMWKRSQQPLGFGGQAPQCETVNNSLMMWIEVGGMKGAEVRVRERWEGRFKKPWGIKQCPGVILTSDIIVYSTVVVS